MQHTADETADLHEVEYWARQVRLGAWIAIFLTAIGGVRVLVDWPSAQRWWIGPIGLAVAAQVVAAPLNWERIVRSKPVRQGLVAWYVCNVGMLFAFCAFDKAGLSIYPAAGLVIVVAAGALLAPRTVLLVGVLTAVG